MRCAKELMLLYGVTDRSWTGRQTLAEQVEDALKGGVTLIQLREKDLDDHRFLEEAKEINALCSRYQIPCIINDNVEIALASNAQGVHVGQNDMKVQNVRAKAGEDKIIGVSVETVEQAVFAEQNGADYLGVGAMFSTSTKLDASLVSKETLRSICQAVHIPVVAIGGIDEDNIGQLSGTGIHGVAVVSALFGKPDIKTAAEKLRFLSERMVKG